MGLQVDTQVFKWLQNLALAKDGRRTSDNKVELPEDISVKIYDGVIIGLMIKDIVKLHSQQNLFEKLDAIKQNSTPAIRLYNWNILIEILKKLSLVIQYAEKSKILNMDPAPIQKVLSHLYQLHVEDVQEQQQKPLQVDITEVGKKQLKDANNILEFFVISISKNFKLSPQHTLNLFLDNNKYLAHLLVKGVKNSYEPIFAFLSDISDNIDYIVVTLFCTDQEESIKFFLNAIKPALISKEVEVAEKCSNLLEAVYDTYKMNSVSLQNCQKWLRQEGLSTVFFAIKRHPILLGKIMTVTYLYLQQQLFSSLSPAQKSILWQNQFQKLTFFTNLLHSIPIDAVYAFAKTKQFNLWIKLLIKMMKKAKQSNQSLALLSIMSWMWLNLQADFQANQNGLPNAFLAFLKGCSLHESDIVFINSIQIMFNLMQVLGNRKNNNAPFIYKILVNCFSFSGIVDRVSFIAINFKQAFQQIKNLPGGPLVDPLVKNLSKQVSTESMILAQILMEENRITQDEIIELIEVLSSIIFHNTIFGEYALEIIFENINIMNEEMLDQFLDKNSKNGLAHFYSTTGSIKRAYSQLKSDHQRYKKELEGKKGKNSFVEEIDKHIILGNLIKFVQKCLDQSQNLKETLEPVLFYTYIRIKSQLKKNQEAELLMPLMKQYYPAEDRLEERVQYYQEQLNPPKQSLRQSIGDSIQASYEDQEKQDEGFGNRSIVKKNRSILNKSLDLQDQSRLEKPLDLSILKPSPYALKDLDRIKKKLQQTKIKGQRRQRKLDLIQQKKQLFRSVLNEKRIIQFGAKNVLNKDYKSIFQWDTIKEENQNRVHGIPEIKLINLRYDQEVAYAEDVDSVLKKYRKVWRFLFFKYSSFGAKEKEEFKSQQKINMAEVWKMIKQYGLLILKKEESHALVRIINENMKRKNDLQNLTYLGFEQYIFQMCNYGYNKSGYAHVPPGQKIMMMIKQIKDTTEKKGGNIQLFQNPEEVYFQETDVIREFNRRLKQNPQYILPEGYKKVRMMELHYQYEIHPVNIQGITSSYTDVLEVLDEILSENKDLGFHIIEPLTHKVQKTIAKPSLFQDMNEKMKNYKQGYLQPKQPPTTAQQKKRENTIPFKNQFHPHIDFSLGIKLGLAGVNMKYKYIGNEVAYLMDDMLDAIEKGGNKVQNKGKKRIDNEALKRKRASLQKMKVEQKQNEKKWKTRAESIKAKAEAEKEAKKSEEKKKRDERRQLRKKEKQKQQRELKKKLEEYQQAKNKLDEKKRQEETRRKAELQKRKKQKQQYKKGVEQYFLKKKEELEEKQASMKKAREDEKQKELQQKQKKEEFMKKLHFNILKKQGGVLEKIEELKKGYEETWNDKQIQQTFDKYEIPLNHLFDLLLKHQKSKISATNNDEISLSTLQFFALKFKIVPFMLQKNNLAKIFKGVGRISHLHTGINYDGFKEVLFRISVKSKDLLNELADSRKGNKKITQNDEENELENSGSPSPSKMGSSISPKKQGLAQQYLYNTEGVNQETVEQLLRFLNLPYDKQGVEERYREVLESKGKTKPRNMLVRQLKNSLD